MTSGLDTSIGFVSTFPPTECGIATYTNSLIETLIEREGTDRAPIGVVRLTDGLTRDAGAPVVFNHRTGVRSSLQRAIAVLNSYDAVSIQHEFGIYGGRDGAEVLDLMSGLRVPTVVTLHTVLAHPTRRQSAIMERMCEMVDKVVVLSATAATRLVDLYGVGSDRISVIQHGAHPEFAGPSLVTGDRPLILTWGLIGPGKGLEWAIEALTDLADLDPTPRYLIAGATHPNVRQESGETYRNGLESLTQTLGLESLVEFDGRYLSRRELARLVRSADVVVLPYESPEQVTSGVLMEAIAASKPVVATAFPHALEMLSGGAGAVVPFGQPRELGRELRRIILDRPTRQLMGERARELATDGYWPAVAERFVETMSAVATSRTSSPVASPVRQHAAG